MSITETLHGQKFIDRVKELEAKGHRFEGWEVGASNAEWIITYYPLPEKQESQAELGV